MPYPTEIAELFDEFAALFDTENRPGAIEAASALRETDLQRTELRADPEFERLDTCVAALSLRPHSVVPTVLAALPHISWHFPGYDDGRIPAEISLSMATAELIGPDGLYFHPTVRVGLFMQSANLNYVTRIHAPEETFIMLGGSGYWSRDGSALMRADAGDMLHHPSNTPHVSVTRVEPLIAAWRWTGDIGWDSYELVG